MSYIPPYDPRDFRVQGQGFQGDGLWIRTSVVIAVNSTTGLVTLEWLDYPGVRTDVPVSQPSPGIFELPPIGALVLVNFDQGSRAQIVRHLPSGYETLVTSGDIRQLKSGEKLLVSYTEESIQSRGFPIPSLTGTLFHMNSSGDIEMATASGERWTMRNAFNEIDQSSMNYRVQTEAGLLDFGLTKRIADEDDIEGTIIDTDGNKFPSSTQLDPEALTEFRLRILDQADANFTTAPEVDDPYIEFTLGINVDNDGKLVKTTSDHAHEDKKVVIKLSTKAGQGFEFVIDEDGNVTLITKGDLKIASSGNATIEIGKDADITAKNINVSADNVKLTGSTAVVLESFISAFNSHTHPHVVGPGVTSAPLPSIIPSEVISKKVKVS